MELKLIDIALRKTIGVGISLDFEFSEIDIGLICFWITIDFNKKIGVSFNNLWR